MVFDSLVVPPQNEAIYTILFAMTYWYNTKGYLYIYIILLYNISVYFRIFYIG